MLKKTLLGFGVCIGLLACAYTIPREDMVMAKVALEAAKEANADTHEPALYQKADYYFKAARQSFKNHEYGMAQEFAVQSKIYSEKAEEGAILKQEQSGG
ncbi:MAG: hypothetical protein A3B70_08370 [Deltaproteobacteria bacterium RIFCSPHIGHO2_02_FULL_40_11]|nr:MAG: hypothetical protein A3B70_08370 [Deltaproteobacteria bacterium RIFCSPHIGHO2_02_FULL_40_11]